MNGRVVISIPEEALIQATNPKEQEPPEDAYVVTNREKFFDAVAEGILTLEDDSDRELTQALRTLIRRVIEGAACAETNLGVELI